MPEEATHFLALYYEENKFFPDDPYFLGRKESPTSGDIYSIEDLSDVLAYFQKKDEEFIQWKKKEQEKADLQESLIPVVQAFVNRNKDKGRFNVTSGMGTSGINLSIHHITWGDSQTVIVDKLIQEGESYLEQVLQYLIKRRDDVHKCWVKEDLCRALKRQIETLMPEGFNASIGGDWDVYIGIGRHSHKVTSIESLPNLIEELTLLNKEEEIKLNKVKDLRKSKKPIPKKLLH